MLPVSRERIVTAVNLLPVRFLVFSGSIFRILNREVHLRFFLAAFGASSGVAEAPGAVAKLLGNGEHKFMTTLDTSDYNIFHVLFLINVTSYPIPSFIVMRQYPS